MESPFEGDGRPECSPINDKAAADVQGHRPEPGQIVDGNLIGSQGDSFQPLGAFEVFVIVRWWP